MSAVEGVWSKDIEEAFEEALAVYPPCGRRKIILSDEGKMYGRNELIARYIKMRTGKTRTRKQVSSHIQVLSRKRGRDQQKNKQASPQLSRQSDSSTEPPLSVVSTYTGHSQSPSVTWSTNARPYLPQFISPDSKLSLTAQPEDVMQPITQNQSQALHNQILYTPLSNPTLSLASARQYSESVRLVLSELAVAFEYVDESAVRNYHCVAEIKGFSLYAPPLEAVNANLLFPKLPGLRELFQRGPKDAFFLAKVACNIDLPPVDGFYTLSSKYQAIGREAPIKCSLKLFLAGRLEVEKILVGIPESQVSMGASQYSFQHSPLCDAAVSLMNTLRQQPSKEEADEILAGVTALLSVYDRQLHQTLFVMVLVFHTTPHAARCQLLRLV